MYSTVTVVNNDADLKLLEKQTISTPGMFHSLGCHDWFKHKSLNFFGLRVLGRQAMRNKKDHG